MNYFKLISLDDKAYQKVLIQLAEENIVGRASYDAIILECAHQTKVQQIISSNAQDFNLLNNAFGYKMDVIPI